MSVEEVKARERAVWSLGHYAEIAKLIEPAAVALADACAVSAGQEALDVGAGNGNFAVAATREGAKVVATDLVPAQVALGRARTEAEGLDVEWLEADVEELPFEDGRFDCVGSVFAAIFAPRPERAASEMLRVTRPGGAVGITSWAIDGFQARMFQLARKRAPLPEGVPSADLWGDERVARERFRAAASVDVRRQTVRFEFESPRAMRAFFEENAGPSVAARRVLPADVYDRLAEEQLRVVQEFNEAADGSVRISSDYLLIVARKRG